MCGVFSGGRSMEIVGPARKQARKFLQNSGFNICGRRAQLQGTAMGLVVFKIEQ